jgi:arylsulfatase A-like enzyme
LYRPNFLIVVVDSAQPGAYAVNGGQARTPHVERIACEGMRFTNAWTTAPICHPGRASIFTGLFPRGNGIITNAVVHNWYPFKQLDGVKSFAEVLGESGYRCGYAGQWHVQDIRGFHDNRAVPTRQHVEALKARGITVRSIPERSFKGCGRLNIGLEDSRDAEFAREALKLIDEYAKLDQPWLIECDFDGPHPPCHIPAPYDAIYDPAEMRLPPNLRDPLDDKPYVVRLSRKRQGTGSWTNDEWRNVLAHYYGNITMLDDLFGRLLKRLDALNLAKNTVVVFTSDHGGMLGAHGFLVHGSPAMFDEGLRTPLFVKWPGNTKPGSACDEFVSHVDLLPTLAEMAGVKPFTHHVSRITPHSSVIPLSRHPPSGVRRLFRV